MNTLLLGVVIIFCDDDNDLNDDYDDDDLNDDYDDDDDGDYNCEVLF